MIRFDRFLLQTPLRLNMQVRQLVVLVLIFLNVTRLSAMAPRTKLQEICGYEVCSLLSHYCDRYELECVACATICHFQGYPNMQRHCEQVCPRYLEEQRMNNTGVLTTAGTPHHHQNSSRNGTDGIAVERSIQPVLPAVLSCLEIASIIIIILVV